MSVIWVFNFRVWGQKDWALNPKDGVVPQTIMSISAARILGANYLQ